MISLMRPVKDIAEALQGTPEQRAAAKRAALDAEIIRLAGEATKAWLVGPAADGIRIMDALAVAVLERDEFVGAASKEGGDD